MQFPNFGDNLRLLCSFKPSITELARLLNINRSQLNKYLVGSSYPRPAILRRICDHFGVESHEILMPPQDFCELIKVRGVPKNEIARRLEHHVEKLLRKSDPRILGLEGVFFEYYASMSTPGSILKTLLCFEVHDKVIYYKRYERVGLPYKKCHTHFRYQGIALMLGDRIFLTDYEYDLKVELTQTVLYPDYSKRLSRLVGIKVGVAANRLHAPCAARVYLERTAPNSLLATNLRQCGLYPDNSHDIPQCIREAVNNETSGPGHFLVRPDSIEQPVDNPVHSIPTGSDGPVQSAFD